MKMVISSDDIQRSSVRTLVEAYYGGDGKDFVPYLSQIFCIKYKVLNFLQEMIDIYPGSFSVLFIEYAKCFPREVKSSGL